MNLVEALARELVRVYALRERYRKTVFDFPDLAPRYEDYVSYYGCRDRAGMCGNGE